MNINVWNREAEKELIKLNPEYEDWIRVSCAIKRVSSKIKDLEAERRRNLEYYRKGWLVDDINPQLLILREQKEKLLRQLPPPPKVPIKEPDTYYYSSDLNRELEPPKVAVTQFTRK